MIRQTRTVTRQKVCVVCASALFPLVVGGSLRTASAARVEAYVGQPFGVGVVTLPVNGGGAVTPLEDERFTVETADGRALYPAVKEERARRLIRRLLEIETPSSATIYFLFRGDAPLELKAYSPSASTIAVTPTQDPEAHRRLLGEWWQAYSARWKASRLNLASPPVVENFVTVNLSRRLGLALPALDPPFFGIFQPKRTVWDDLLVTERRQLEIDQQLMEGRSVDAGKPGPLPPQMPWVDLPAPSAPPVSAAANESLPPSASEPIAAHVPAECFYLRFGTFSNYLWFRDLNKKWYGDLGNMVSRRGIDKASDARIEQQLALKENAMAKILGPQVIADVAIIGLDPYVDQGAAIGIVFQAKNSLILAHDITSERTEALTRFADGSMTSVKIAEIDVSLASTPGGEIRSYYVADGDFHLVTTSRRLVERFLQAGRGTGALADSAGFRGVRQQMRGDRGDAVFVYVSPEFVRNLTSPAIWIEVQRRVAADRVLKLRQLARMQAIAEGLPLDESKGNVDLDSHGMLPEHFNSRPDSMVMIDGKGPAFNFPRGRPGLFTPAADRPASKATAAESAAYGRFADRFRQEVGQSPPIAIAARRAPLADGSGETVIAEVLATPLDDVKLGKLRDMLGEPSNERVAAVPGDLIRAEAVMGKVLPLAGQTDPNHLFLAIRDFHSPLVVRRGQISPGADSPAIVRFYMGAWPKPGLMRIFAGPQVARGAEPTPTGTEMWQGLANDTLLICFSPDLVREILPQLTREAVDRPAQVWLDVLNLAGTELETTINALGYQRARETSVAACRLMNTLDTQLHEPAANCRATGETLVDGQFVCALGGEYQVVAVPTGRTMWTSSALAPQNQFLLTEAPADFHLPLLTWFRGARADASLTAEAISAHVEIDMAKSAIP